MIVDDDGADAECLDQLGVCSMDTSGGLAEVAQQDAAAAALSEGESPVSWSGDTISRAPCREGGPTFDGMDVDAVQESGSESKPPADQSSPLEEPPERPAGQISWSALRRVRIQVIRVSPYTSKPSARFANAWRPFW